MVNVYLQSGLFKMIGIAFNRKEPTGTVRLPFETLSPSRTLRECPESEKASKRDLKKHGIQPFVSNNDLPMTQQRCVVSFTTPFSMSLVKYENLLLKLSFAMPN